MIYPALARRSAGRGRIRIASGGRAISRARAVPDSEAYFLRGGMEAVYVDMPVEVGFLKFAPQASARGPMFSARERARVVGKPVGVVPVAEAELCGTDGASGSGSA